MIWILDSSRKAKAINKNGKVVMMMIGEEEAANTETAAKQKE